MYKRPDMGDYLIKWLEAERELALQGWVDKTLTETTKKEAL